MKYHLKEGWQGQNERSLRDLRVYLNFQWVKNLRKNNTSVCDQIMVLKNLVNEELAKRQKKG